MGARKHSLTHGGGGGYRPCGEQSGAMRVFFCDAYHVMALPHIKTIFSVRRCGSGVSTLSPPCGLHEAAAEFGQRAAEAFQKSVFWTG